MEQAAHRPAPRRDRRPRPPVGTRPGLRRVAIPLATLILTVGLEVFEAPLLSVLAALRLYEALQPVPEAVSRLARPGAGGGRRG